MTRLSELPTQARTEADSLKARPTLWQILATLAEVEEQRGDEMTAA